MRIELPAAPSWSASHRAQDDAHTLTLPATGELAAPWVRTGNDEPAGPVRVSALPAQAPSPVTLTF